MSGESNDAGFSPMSPVYPFNEEPFLITVDALDGDNAMSLPSTRPTSPAMPVCVVRPLFPLPECPTESFHRLRYHPRVNLTIETAAQQPDNRDWCREHNNRDWCCEHNNRDWCREHNNRDWCREHNNRDWCREHNNRDWCREHNNRDWCPANITIETGVANMVKKIVEDLSAADWEENGFYARVSVGPAVCGSVIEMGRSATFHPFLVITSACVAIKSASKVVGRRRQGRSCRRQVMTTQNYVAFGVYFF
ncbi:hypothetical protein JTE90_015042 [Oedothorax gibbosus]|uniref:Peptidase S1 domain-containing protein n=1 Tax=Oedothorax gibbosus TaxID=931172 RepID=A0AAV6TW04_9ARAC|nr:hypothetical protein JTE90_015042 [Oedothorax gibbosus]